MSNKLGEHSNHMTKNRQNPNCMIETMLSRPITYLLNLKINIFSRIPYSPIFAPFFIGTHLSSLKEICESSTFFIIVWRVDNLSSTAGTMWYIDISNHLKPYSLKRTESIRLFTSFKILDFKDIFNLSGKFKSLSFSGNRAIWK